MIATKLIRKNKISIFEGRFIFLGEVHEGGEEIDHREPGEFNGGKTIDTGNAAILDKRDQTEQLSSTNDGSQEDLEAVFRDSGMSYGVYSDNDDDDGDKNTYGNVEEALEVDLLDDDQEDRDSDVEEALEVDLLDDDQEDRDSDVEGTTDLDQLESSLEPMDEEGEGNTSSDQKPMNEGSYTHTARVTNLVSRTRKMLGLLSQARDFVEKIPGAMIDSDLLNP